MGRCMGMAFMTLRRRVMKGNGLRGSLMVARPLESKFELFRDIHDYSKINGFIFNYKLKKGFYEKDHREERVITQDGR